MKPATLKRFVRLGDFHEHLELHRLDCSSSHGHLDNYEFVRRFLEDTPPEKVRPPRLISGDDLIALGLQPSPEFKGLLDAVEEAQLNGAIDTHEDALEFVRRRVGRHSKKRSN